MKNYWLDKKLSVDQINADLQQMSQENDSFDAPSEPTQNDFPTVKVVGDVELFKSCVSSEDQVYINGAFIKVKDVVSQILELQKKIIQQNIDLMLLKHQLGNYIKYN